MCSIFGEVPEHGHNKFETEGQFDAKLDPAYRDLSRLRGLRELGTKNSNLDRNRKNSRVSPGKRGFEADWLVPALGETTVWRLAPKTVSCRKSSGVSGRLWAQQSNAWMRGESNGCTQVISLKVTWL